MKTYYITFRSVTFAQRAEALLRGQIRCSLQRTPRWMEAQGCGYALRLWTSDIDSVVKRLRDGAIPMRRVYLQQQTGFLEEQSL